jgi:hypothetical protein
MFGQEKIRLCGYKIPKYFWFVLSGSLCDCCQALIDYLISIIYAYEWEKATICWTLSYTVSIMIRHFSHKYIVFGDYDGSYCTSLGRTYLTYSSSIVISTIANHCFMTYFLLSHKQAWVITMLWTGLYNYFMLKRNWKGIKKENNSDKIENDEENSLISERVE